MLFYAIAGSATVFRHTSGTNKGIRANAFQAAEA
jgi:hypothetical protein